MAKKTFVNQTPFSVHGELMVRAGNEPGKNLNSIAFTIEENNSQEVTFGDDENPFMNGVELSIDAQGGIILANLIILSKDSSLDIEFNKNNTVYINVAQNSLVVTTANT